MIEDYVFIGLPINFQDKFFIYPPTIEDIVKFGYEKFLYITSVLTKTKEELEEEKIIDGEQIKDVFTFIMALGVFPGDMGKELKACLSLFTKQQITFLPEIKSIVVGKFADKALINAENFEDFQNIIRCSIGLKPAEKEDPNLDPRIKRFKMLQRKRDAVKAKQNSGDAPVQLISLLTSLCNLGCGITPMNVSQLTYGAAHQLINRYIEKDQYETTIASMLAGAKPDKKLSFWMKDLK